MDRWIGGMVEVRAVAVVVIVDDACEGEDGWYVYASSVSCLSLLPIFPSLAMSGPFI